MVEIDGATHGTAEEIAYDERRTRFMESDGWRVIRFTNLEVEKSREGVRTTILMALEEQVEWLRAR